MIDDKENLLRLVWNSRDFGKDGKLKGTAFAPRDLIPLNDPAGRPRYLSMDIKALINQASVDWNVNNAMNAGKGAKLEKRIEPLFAEFNCGELRALGDGSALGVFNASLAANESGPGSPANSAHVGVQSLSPDPFNDDDRQLKIEELRTLLLAARRDTLTYEELFGPAKVA